MLFSILVAATSVAATATTVAALVIVSSVGHFQFKIDLKIKNFR